MYKFFLLLTFFFTFFFEVNSIENRILVKVNNEIITTIDISNEISYLALFNKDILDLEKNAIIEIAKNNLIQNKIKRKEILKYSDEIKINSDYLNKMIQNTYEQIGIKDLNNFIKLLEENNISLKYIENKIALNENWKQLIYLKYKDKIKINKLKITKEVSNKKNIFFNLSEILFNLEENSNLEKKFTQISYNIKKNGFENTALIFSVSDSSKQGGKLGWISGRAISENILKELNKIKLGDFTNPIRTPGGFLILKIDGYKEEDKKKDNINKQVNNIINLKISEQLKQFSNLYLNKLKKDSSINEL